MDCHFCSICSNKYDHETRIPKLLVECGHSFCCTCINALFSGSKRCFLCQVSLTKEEGMNYPTVYALLGAREKKKRDTAGEPTSKKFKELDDKMKFHQRELIAVNKNLQNLKHTETKLESSKLLHHKELDIIKQSLSKLKLPEEKLDEPGISNSSMPLSENMASKGIATSSHRVLDEKKVSADLELEPATSEPQYSIKLSSFGTVQGYRQEVCRRIKLGEKVFVCYQCNNKFLYGKVSFPEGWDKKDLSPVNALIKVSSMTIPHVEDVVLLKFEDLKKGIEEEFIAFIEFFDIDKRKGEYILCLNASPLAKQFAKLCTGEEGFTYKGSKIHYSGHPYFSFKVTNYLKEGIPASGMLPSTSLSVTSDRPWNLGEGNVLVGFQDGSFEIKWFDNDYSTTHILSEEIFWYGLASRGEKIADCGIYIPC